MYIFLSFIFITCMFYTSEDLHQFSFNIPPSGAEMNGLERILCASSMRKGVKLKMRISF